MWVRDSKPTCAAGCPWVCIRAALRGAACACRGWGAVQSRAGRWVRSPEAAWGQVLLSPLLLSTHRPAGPQLPTCCEGLTPALPQAWGPPAALGKYQPAPESPGGLVPRSARLGPRKVAWRQGQAGLPCPSGPALHQPSLHPPPAQALSPSPRPSPAEAQAWEPFLCPWAEAVGRAWV